MDPLLSVCVQTYNHEGYIKQCLDGIMIQETSFPFEVLLGEDESSDRTRQICQEYAAKYPEKIRLFLRSRKDVIHINGNATGRFNFTENLKAARGKYIALCEGDDYWTDPTKLQRQVDFLEANPSYALCFHSIDIRDEATQTISEDDITREVPETTTLEDLSRGNYIHTPTVVFRNDYELPSWFMEVPMGDFPLYCALAKKGDFYKLKDVMAVYRVHDKGMMQNFKPGDIIKKIPYLLSLIQMNMLLFEESKIARFKITAFNIYIDLRKKLLLGNHFSEVKKMAGHVLAKYPTMLSFKEKMRTVLTWLAPKMLKN